MAFDYTRFGGSLLSGLGSGLMAAGSEGGWNNFGGGFMQGQQAYDQNQFRQQDMEERRKMQALQEQQIQMQLEAQRTANQDRVRQQQAIDKMIGGGLMAPNGMSQAQFGGAPIEPGMMSQNFSPQQIEAIRAMPLEMQTQILGKELFKESEKKPPINIGGVLYDPDDPNVVIADHSDVLLKQKIAGRPVTNINTNIPAEQNSADKELGKLDAQTFTDIQTAGLQAQTTLAKLDRLAPLLQQVGTGKFTGTTIELKKAAKSAGVDLDALGITDNTAVADAAKPLIGELTLQLRNPSGGAGMPGAMSDQDRQFLQAMVPNLETDPDAVPMIIDFNRRLAKRSQEVAKVARDYRAKNNGHIDAGFYDEIQKYADAHPLFTEVDQAKIERLGTGKPAVKLPTGAVDSLSKQGLPTIYLFNGPDGMYWGDETGKAVQ